MSRPFDPDTLQGNILRGYTFGRVRHLMLGVKDRKTAAGFLALAAGDGNDFVPAITRERNWTAKPETTFNVGFTFEGLRALGATPRELAAMPTEFREGMHARAGKLGDWGTSAPATWAAPFDRPERIHLVASIYADTEVALDAVQVQVAHGFAILGVRDGSALPETVKEDGKDVTRPSDRVHFGYRDSISEPKVKGIRDASQNDADEPEDPLGTVLLGRPSLHGATWFGGRDPGILIQDGTFNAFRILAQDCVAFEDWLTEAATVLEERGHAGDLLDLRDPWWERQEKPLTLHGALREVVAAQMCGRWRNGMPVELSPESPEPVEKRSFTNFDYNATSRCPAGAHMRRCNPRGGPIVQRVANYTRRLVRRGMPYGAPFDPANPDDRERGLLGNFIGASLGAQFEAVMSDWLNLGLQDPDVTGSNDPLIGANVPETSWFDMVLRDGTTVRLRGFPRFVRARGGAYLFLPSLPAIRDLAGRSL